MSEKQSAADLRNNLPSWQGMGNSYTRLFGAFPEDEREEFVRKALGRLSESVVGIKCLFDYASKRPDTNSGTYLVELRDDRRVILHAKEFVHEPTYRLGDEVYAEYNKAGISTARLVSFPDGAISREHDGLSVYLTTFTEGEHPDRISDLFHVGLSLAHVHHVNKNLPDVIQNNVRKNTESTLEWFKSGIEFFGTSEGQKILLDTLLGNTKTAVFVGKAIGRFAEAMEGTFVIGSTDMIPGNILINKNTEEVTFLDFDNIAASMMPVGVDIGLATYRVAMDFVKDADGTWNDKKAVETLMAGFNASVYAKDKLDLQTMFRYAVFGNLTKVLTQGHRIKQGLCEGLTETENHKTTLHNLQRLAGMIGEIDTRFQLIASSVGQFPLQLG